MCASWNWRAAAKCNITLKLVVVIVCFKRVVADVTTYVTASVVLDVVGVVVIIDIAIHFRGVATTLTTYSTLTNTSTATRVIMLPFTKRSSTKITTRTTTQ